MDWKAWHSDYDNPTSALSRRLAVVQHKIRDALDRLPSRPWQAVSLCAGDGRDLLGVVAGHPRSDDMTALLVELNPDLAEDGRRAYQAAGLTNVEIRTADAGDRENYGGIEADLLLVCGVMGNLTDEGVFRLIEQLPALCALNATVVWTRHRRPPDLTPAIRAALTTAGFSEVAFHALDDSWGSVGSAMLERRVPAPEPTSDPLFTFTADKSQEWQQQP